MDKQEVTVTELLTQIYHRINVVVRSATKEAVEQAFKDKSSKGSVMDEENLSATQAAIYLKIQLNTLYSKVEKGDLPYSRSGKRKLLFLKSDLENYVANRKVKSKEEINNDVETYLNTKK